MTNLYLKSIPFSRDKDCVRISLRSHNRLPIVKKIEIVEIPLIIFHSYITHYEKRATINNHRIDDATSLDSISQKCSTFKNLLFSFSKESTPINEAPKNTKKIKVLIFNTNTEQDRTFSSKYNRGIFKYSKDKCIRNIEFKINSLPLQGRRGCGNVDARDVAVESQ